MERGALLPRLDFRLIESRLPEALADMRTALRGGAFYLDVSSVLSASFQRRVLRAATKFFAMSSDNKNAVDISKSSNYRGYVAVYGEHTNGVPDLKESFEFGTESSALAATRHLSFHKFYEANQYPPGLADEAFRAALHDFQERMTCVSECMSDALLRTLGLPPQSPTENCLTTGESFHFARLIHYEGLPSDTDRVCRIEPHRDEGLFTFLLEDSPGLEVESANGDWCELAAPAGCMITFASQLTEFLTRGLYRACLHRIPNSVSVKNRMSVGFFSFPDLRNQMIPVPARGSAVVSAPDLRSDLLARNIWLAETSQNSETDGLIDRFSPFVLGERLWTRAATLFPDDEG